MKRKARLAAMRQQVEGGGSSNSNAAAAQQGKGETGGDGEEASALKFRNYKPESEVNAEAIPEHLKPQRLELAEQEKGALVEDVEVLGMGLFCLFVSWFACVCVCVGVCGGVCFFALLLCWESVSVSPWACLCTLV